MASTSASSSVQKSFKYDVFLSFRGDDTRKTFVDHLYHALHHQGITTYKDDERIEQGERIDDQLFRSIEDSRIYLIVFSKNYASSSWCLDELVHIMECHKTKDQTAYPIFYDVEPTEVRNQSGVVGEAFAKHVETECAGRWRNALKEAADLAGWELKNTVDGHEAKFIHRIVKYISRKPHIINSSVDRKLVGMGTRLENVVSSLEIDSEDVRMIGIKGMGGGGKTTLARAVFDHISTRFEGKSFVENVREVSKDSLFGLKKLQTQVLRNVLNDQTIVVPSVSDGKDMMKKIMGSIKILVVLDDVDNIGQLEALAGEPSWFKSGSRIIITTRDEQVLVAHQVSFIHDISLLSNEEATCLLSRNAFGREVPLQGYEELSGKVVHYAAGLPLTIKVLGAFLYGRIESEWENTIERLKTIPLKETLEKLELSYNGLESDQKEIFLDIACILKGETKKKITRILESRGFCAQIGLRVLEQKSLITISNYGWVLVHDHIEEMGRNIVRRLHPDDPKRHSRLWIKEEIEDVLVNESGTEETKCIRLEYTNLHPAIIMKGLRKINELRFLYVHNGYRQWKVDAVSQYLPDALQSLCWDAYPFCCLPKTFSANKLLNLELVDSCITQLWDVEEIKVLDKLRYLDLSGSKLTTFDLGMTPNLETLNLGGCIDFVVLYILKECPKLKFLNLSVSKVRTLNLEMTPNLERLNLYGCKYFEELHMPVECPKLKDLNLRGSMVSNLNLEMTPCLERLNLEGCNYLQHINAPEGCLKNIVYLNLSGCPRFHNFLVDKEKLSCGLDFSARLEATFSIDKYSLHLYGGLSKAEFVCFYNESLPSSSGNLEKLLGLCACINFESFSASICGLQHLSALTLKAGLREVPKDLGQLKSLKKLSLWMENIRYLPNNVCMMRHMKSLELRSCFFLQQLPKDLGRLECLEKLDLIWCKALKDIPNSICEMKSLKHLSVFCCILVKKLPDELGLLKCLKTLDINDTGISSLPQSTYQLKGLRIYGSRRQLESYGFTSLIETGYRACYVEL